MTQSRQVGTGQDDKRARTLIRLTRYLMFSILLGAAGISAFFTYMPQLGISKELCRLRRELHEAEAAAVAAKDDLTKNPTDPRVIRLAETTESRVDALRDEMKSHGLFGHYWLKLVVRDGSINEMGNVYILHAILGVLFTMLAYTILIVLFHALPGCRRFRSRKCPHRRRRMESLQHKWEQTEDVDAVRAENETLSAMDENHAALGLTPLQIGEWLMPIMGFIGTVVGISSAINSLQLGIRLVFSQGQLTPEALGQFNEGFAGLGMAFDTTFFGLIGLSFTGLAAFLLRRRALATITAIDAVTDGWIAALVDPGGKRWQLVEQHIAETHEMLEKVKKTRLIERTAQVTQKIEEHIAETHEMLEKVTETKLIEQAAELMQQVREQEIVQFLALLKKIVAENFETVATELGALRKWINEEFKPGITREFRENPAFRQWVTQQLPRFVAEQMQHQTRGVLEGVKGASDQVSGQIGRYGNMLVRLTASCASSTYMMRVLQWFMIGCIDEAAAAVPENPFWEKFREALRKPIDTAPDMTLIVPGTRESRVDCLTLSGLPYMLAVARTSSTTGQCTITVHAIEMLVDGGEMTVHPSGVSGQGMATSVDAMAFSPSGGHLAYTLMDGTVGVYDSHTGTHTETTLEEAPVRNCLAWRQRGGESLLVVVPTDEGLSKLIQIPVTEVGLGSDHSLVLALEGVVDCQALVASQKHPRVIVAGQDLDRRPVVKIIEWNEGALVDSRTFPIDVGKLSGVQFRSVSLSGPQEDSILCGMSNGMIVRIPAGPVQTPTDRPFDAVQGREPVGRQDLVMPGGGESVVLVGTDTSGDVLAVGLRTAETVRLFDVTTHAPIRDVRSHGPISVGSLSPNRRVLAVGGQDGHAAVWYFPVYVIY